MKLQKLFIAGLLAIFSVGTVAAERLHLTTDHTSLVLDATKGQDFKIVYYGDKLSYTDLNALPTVGYWPQSAYPVYGKVTCTKENALSVVHADGNMTTETEVESFSTKAVDGGTLTTVTIRDKVYPLYVDVCYLTRKADDVIESWTEIYHKEKSEVTLTQYASMFLPIRVGNVWLTQMYGSWGNECRLQQTALDRGMRVIKNLDGARNSHMSHSEVMFSLDGKPQENVGRVIGAVLCYSGNYKLRINTEDTDYHQFFAGINEENSQYHLAPGERFPTPHVALTYSCEGHSGASRNFHHWARHHALAHGDTPRRVLLNSWEGVYFDINEQGMQQMMSDIADMGGELFVMDDGWFGNKYHRDTDNCALGDWVVDTNKLPGGIQGLIDSAKARGIDFGLWIEPESTNLVSEFYEKHPEYVIKAENRSISCGRGGTQVVLDLANPAVQDVIFNMVDTLLTNYPGISYLKWDANCSIADHGSQYLTADNQSHLFVDYHRGLSAVLQRIRAKYPEVTIQACGGGGGRASYGVLPWFDEFWTSDNTDALQRVYIQWGTSYFFPSIAMAAHISAAPNHQTGRIIPLKYRIDVAMSGRLGMEIQPENMTADEKDMCRRAIAQYKDVRNIIQMGNLYRLQSPYESNASSLVYVNDEKDEAVMFWYKTETFRDQHLARVVFAGLDPDKTYRIRELNRIDKTPLYFEGETVTGRFLMTNGLEFPWEHNVSPSLDYSSRVLYLSSEN